MKIFNVDSEAKKKSKVNEVYAEFFKDHKPARTVVPSRNLHCGCLIEIDAIAHT
jgi:enamine deaminase RidA (YjgF/YER057c/UK114 family)